MQHAFLLQQLANCSVYIYAYVGSYIVTCKYVCLCSYFICISYVLEFNL